MGDVGGHHTHFHHLLLMRSSDKDISGRALIKDELSRLQVNCHAGCHAQSEQHQTNEQDDPVGGPMDFASKRNKSKDVDKLAH